MACHRERGAEWWSYTVNKLSISGASLVIQWWRIRLPMQVTGVQSLGREDPVEKEMATHSSILSLEIPWTQELGRLQPMGSQKEFDTT